MRTVGGGEIDCYRIGALRWVCALMSQRAHAVERRLLAGGLAAVGGKDLAGYERSVV